MSDDFVNRLTRLLQRRRPNRVSIEGARDAAVLLPVITDPEPSLLFTVRTETLPSHKGQISFPGGSIDADDASPQEAALRETNEEIGLPPSSIEIIGELDTTPTFVSGYVIFPFVGHVRGRPEVRPNPAEVAEVLEVPIAHLTEAIRREPGFLHAGRSYPTEAWVWEERVIWGVTARLVRHFLVLLAQAGLTEEPGPTTSWSAWPLEPTGQ